MMIRKMKKTSLLTKIYALALALTMLIMVFAAQIPNTLAEVTPGTMMQFSDGASFNADGISQSAAVPANPLFDNVKLRGYGTANDATHWPTGFTTTSAAFTGGVYDGKGGLWLIPTNADSVIKVDTNTGMMTRYNNWPAGYTKGLTGFEGGVYDGNGNIWMIPGGPGSPRGVKIDTNTGTMSTYNAYGGASLVNYYGGAYDGNGGIWLVPANVNYVTKIDTATGNGTNYSSWPAGYSLNASGNNFSGGVYDGNGGLWMIPWNAGAVIKVNTADGHMTKYSLPTSITNTTYMTFQGGVYDGNGYIWMIPCNTNAVVKVNVADGTMTTYNGWPSSINSTVLGYNSKFTGGAFDGRYIWMAPQQAGVIVRVDTRDGSMKDYNQWTDLTGFKLGGTGDAGFVGGAFDGNKVWLVPSRVNADRVVSIENAPPSAPVINNVIVGDTTIGGTGTAGLTVTVIFPDNSTVTTTVNPDGTWSVDVPAGYTLRVGDVIMANQTDSNNLTGPNASAKVYSGTPMLQQNGYSQSAPLPFDPLLDQVKLTQYSNWPSTMATYGHSFMAGALDSNGYMWMAPNTARGVARVKLSDGSITFYPFSGATDTSMSGLNSTAAGLFHSCVYDGSRYVWMIPWNANMVVRVDTTNGSMVGYYGWPTSPAGITAGTTNKFVGGVLYNGYLWMAPYNTNVIVRVNLTDGTMTGYNSWPTGFTNTITNFAGAILDENSGSMWMIPYGTNMVVKVNLSNGGTTGYALPSNVTLNSGSTGKLNGGILDGNGYIWMAPEGTNYIVKLNISNGAMITYPLPAGIASPAGSTTNWYFTDAVFDGRFMWMIPNTKTNIVRVDTTNANMTVYNQWTSDLGWASGGNFSSGVFDGENVWMVPGSAAGIVKISPNPLAGLTLSASPNNAKIYQPGVCQITASAANYQSIGGDAVGSIDSMDYFRVPVSDTADYSAAASFTQALASAATKDTGGLAGPGASTASYSYTINADKNAKYWIRVAFTDDDGNPVTQILSILIDNVYTPVQVYYKGVQSGSGAVLYDATLAKNANALAADPSIYGIPYDLNGTAVLTAPSQGYDQINLTAKDLTPAATLSSAGNPQRQNLTLDASFFSLSPAVGINNQTDPYAFTYDIAAYDFNFTKVGDTDAPLPGVQFMLYPCVDPNAPWNANTNDWDLVNGTQAASGNDGMVTYPQLMSGDYLLEEIKAAPGYALPSGQWKITVDVDTQTVQISAIGSPPAFRANTDGTYQLRNYRPLSMPISGGMGTILFTVIGIVFVGAAVILIILTRKKKR